MHTCAWPLATERHLLIKAWQFVELIQADYACSTRLQVQMCGPFALRLQKEFATLRPDTKLIAMTNLQDFDVEQRALVRALDATVEKFHSSAAGMVMIKTALVSSGVLSLSRLLVLVVHDASVSSIPEDIGRLSHLCKLRLSQCRALVVLPESVGDLTSLRQLALRGCSVLRALPERLAELKKLEQLSVADCSKLTALPERIGELQGLTSLELTKCPKIAELPASCLQLPDTLGHVDVQNCKRLQQNYYKPQCKSVKDLHEGLRRQVTVRALLSDRAARLQSLNNMSVVAVLLATAAFVAFAQAPASPGVFYEIESAPASPPFIGAPTLREDTSAATSTSLEPPTHEHAVMWLRRFFVADQLAFVFSMCVVVLVLVSAGPQSEDALDVVQAARVWASFAGLSLLLAGAVVAGVLAFFFAAKAVYPPAHFEEDVFPYKVLVGVLGLIALGNWVLAVWRIFPGFPALRTYGWLRLTQLVEWRQRDVRVPVAGSDDVVAKLLQQAEAQVGITRAMLEQLQSIAEQRNEGIAAASS